MAKHGQQQLKHMNHGDGVGNVGIATLMSAMCGVEACMAFNQVYLFLVLQYLGTPVALMSTPGVLAGVTSLLLLPPLSYYVSRSNQSWKWKWCTIFIGLLTFLIGLLLLMIAGVIKTMDVSRTLERLSILPNISVKNFPSNKFYTNPNSTISFELKKVPLTAVLGIVGFGMIDMSYDIASPAVKSFVLDTVPSHQHCGALATSTVIQGLGGTFVTFISLFDLPTAVESLFDVDGLAGTFLFLCFILVSLLLVSFSATLISGYVIGGWIGKRGGTMYRFIKNGNNNNRKYFQQSERQIRIRNKPPSTPCAKSESISLDISDAQKYKWPDSRQKGRLFKSIDEQKSLLLKDHHRHGPSSQNYGTSRHSESVFTKSQSARLNSPEHPFNIKGNTCASDATSSYGVTSPKSYLTNKRVIITSISCFFANGCLLSFSLYSPNALTIGIYKGDPLALPGFPGRDSFEKGIRHGALGIFLMYISHLVFSASNHKLMQRVGEKPHYFIVCLVVLCSTAAFVITQTAESFFVAMAIFGTFRSCCITTPFVIVSKIVTEEILKTSGGDGGQTMGGAITLLGMMMPAHYLILSSSMGPLINATDNVWIPLFYTIAVLIASVATLALLYCMPHKKKQRF